MHLDIYKPAAFKLDMVIVVTYVYGFRLVSERFLLSIKATEMGESKNFWVSSLTKVSISFGEINVWNMGIKQSAHTHTYARVCLLTHMHIHTHACAHMHTYTHTNTESQTHTHTHTHTHTYTYTHTHTHTCTHTHTHTNTHIPGVALTFEKLRIANAQHGKNCVSSPAAKATISTDLPKIDKHENTNI